MNYFYRLNFPRSDNGLAGAVDTLLKLSYSMKNYESWSWVTDKNTLLLGELLVKIRLRLHYNIFILIYLV
jgi:hypothetical protein